MNNNKDRNLIKISNNKENSKNEINKNYYKKSLNTGTSKTEEEPGNISEEPSSYEDFLRENAFFEDRTINDEDFFKTEAKVNKEKESIKPDASPIPNDDNRRSIEIIIPLISEDKNLYPLFRSFFILLIIVSIAIFGIKSVHFDGYTEFTSKEDYTIKDARKLFLEGKYIDSYNCYNLRKTKYNFCTIDYDYYMAAKAMINLNWKDSKKRIFIKFPKLPFSSIFEKKNSFFENESDKLPTWVKAELYEAAENYFNNKTSNNYYSDEIEIASIYEVCRDYKDSREKYNKYKTLIEHSKKNKL